MRSMVRPPRAAYNRATTMEAKEQTTREKERNKEREEERQIIYEIFKTYASSVKLVEIHHAKTKGDKQEYRERVES